jgi:hypothetical protein
MIPMLRIEVFDGVPLQAMRLDLLLDRPKQFLVPIFALGMTPAAGVAYGLIARRVAGVLVKVLAPLDHDVRRP